MLRAKQFKNVHHGEECIIVGNGPSLKNTDLEKLQEKYTLIFLNKAYLIKKLKPAIKLKYLVAINEHVISQSRKEMIDNSDYVFLPLSKMRLSEWLNSKVIGLNTKLVRAIFSTNINKSIRVGSTVTYSAIQIAFYMGFKKIYLVGVDHNFVQSGPENKLSILNENDVNHFDPTYFKGMKWQNADLEMSEHYYSFAKTILERKGIAITDLTIAGKLNVFEKDNVDKYY